MNGHVQRVDLLQRRAGEGAGPAEAPRQVGRRPRPIRTWRRAGPWRFDAPFDWTKQVASDFGGTRNGMVVHWPKGIKAKGEIRSQFHHVIDVAPTILEAAGLPEPKVVNGTPQIPMEGVSLVYTFDDAKAKDRHTTQYFEIVRQPRRSTTTAGWRGTVHKAPWETQAAPPAGGGRLGALRRARRLQPRQRPRGEEPGRSSPRCRRCS